MRSTITSNSTSVSLTDRLEGLSPLKRALVEKRLGRSLSAPATPFNIGTRPDTATAPLALNQDGLLFMEHLDPGTSRYNVSDAIRVRGVFNEEFVQLSLDKIVARHEALRTVFANDEGVWKQIIRPDASAHLTTVSLHEQAMERREAAALELVQDDASAPMDIHEGPLFSALLVRITDEDNILSIKMHHIISDGWSLGVFWK